MITNTELEYKGNLFPGKISSYEKNVDTLLFKADNHIFLQVQILRDGVLRFRYTTHQNIGQDFSYAITKYHSEGYNHLEIKEAKDKYIITTAKLICEIYKADMRKAIYDVNDKTLLSEDELGYRFVCIFKRHRSPL